MTRGPRPRRIVLDRLAQPTARLRWLKEQWTVTGTVWDLEAPRDERGNVPRRPRRPEEYPENSAAQWQAVHDQATYAAAELAALATYAGEQLAALRARQEAA